MALHSPFRGYQLGYRNPDTIISVRTNVRTSLCVPFLETCFSAITNVPFAMIDAVHRWPEGTAKRTLNDNRERFIEGEDFFALTADAIRTESLSGVFPPRSQGKPEDGSRGQGDDGTVSRPLRPDQRKPIG